ncbi:putative membrane protein [Burkholderia cepacia]|nr:putative membrane protein [Burkholderia cepacia]
MGDTPAHKPSIRDFLPTMMLFVPHIGVYLAIISVVFLFFYFRRS